MLLQMVQKRPTIDVDALFDIAVRAEEAGNKEHAIELYREMDSYPPALINLGTILFHSHQFTESEKFYRQATKIDPDYALAFFNLGNVLDEFGRWEEAADAYKRAVELGHTDAHYNLAWLYQETRQNRLALRHWQAYARLDRSGVWSDQARTQIKRILARESLQLVKA